MKILFDQHHSSEALVRDTLTNNQCDISALIALASLFEELKRKVANRLKN